MDNLTDQHLIEKFHLHRRTIITHEGISYAISRQAGERKLVILAGDAGARLNDYEGSHTTFNGKTILTAALSDHNAAVIRSDLPWLKPRLTGVATSAGLGDRLGLATPGHVRAVRDCADRIIPIFAQQSIREMARTGRTPQKVMDDALWGMLEENWQEGFGADADHLKTTHDIDVCLQAGFTFFTIDPGEYVNNEGEYVGKAELQAMTANLPPQIQLERTGLLDKSFQIDHIAASFDESALLRCMVKYGGAVWHVAEMYQHLNERAGSHPWELEVSVDETASPTSHLEHIYIASELQRLGVKWVSLAPRFVGAFEKGVDYIGDVAEFDTDISGHAAIARRFGPYKLSLHSGSDKFRIYGTAVRQTHGLVHLKTAGTSYLEALRTVAELDQALMKEIYTFARQRYTTDRASYHVSASLDIAPLPEDVDDWNSLLDQFDAREILHVTFGSVLKQQLSDGSLRFYDRLIQQLLNHPEAYAENLRRHFRRHLTPFCRF